MIKEIPQQCQLFVCLDVFKQTPLVLTSNRASNRVEVLDTKKFQVTKKKSARHPVLQLHRHVCTKKKLKAQGNINSNDQA